jgi:hypothetical protein
MGSENGLGVCGSPESETYRIQVADEEEIDMASTIDVEAARIPDRDQLVQLLRDHGLDAEPVDELGIKVPYGDNEPEKGDQILAYVEGVVMDLGAQMIPIKHEGVIYIRPPVG